MMTCCLALGGMTCFLALGVMTNDDVLTCIRSDDVLPYIRNDDVLSCIRSDDELSCKEELMEVKRQILVMRTAASVEGRKKGRLQTGSAFSSLWRTVDEFPRDCHQGFGSKG